MALFGESQMGAYSCRLYILRGAHCWENGKPSETDAAIVFEPPAWWGPDFRDDSRFRAVDIHGEIDYVATLTPYEAAELTDRARDKLTEIGHVELLPRLDLLTELLQKAHLVLCLFYYWESGED